MIKQLFNSLLNKLYIKFWKYIFYIIPKFEIIFLFYFLIKNKYLFYYLFFKNYQGLLKIYISFYFLD